MKKCLFRLSNGLLYEGFLTGLEYNGMPMLEIADDVRTQMLMDENNGLGVSNMNASDYSAIERARVNGRTKTCALWNVDFERIESIALVETRTKLPYSNIAEYAENVLHGNYVDVVLNLDAKPYQQGVPVNETIDGEVQKVFWGYFSSIEDVWSRLRAMGLSSRPSRQKGIPDEALVSKEIFMRRYKHQPYEARCLYEDYVKELPGHLTGMSQSEVITWVDRMYREAQETQPEVDWFGGRTPLLNAVSGLRRTGTDVEISAGKKELISE